MSERTIDAIVDQINTIVMRPGQRTILRVEWDRGTRTWGIGFAAREGQGFYVRAESLAMALRIIIDVCEQNA